jgi:hypothetical protein
MSAKATASPSRIGFTRHSNHVRSLIAGWSPVARMLASLARALAWKDGAPSMA